MTSWSRAELESAFEHYQPMLRAWGLVAAAHGRLPEPGREWLDAMSPDWQD